MLQIRLNKGGYSGDGGGGVGVTSRQSILSETVMVACPDHLILADLPVAKSLGMTPSSNASSVVVKSLGRRSRRNLGERVHFCVSCDFPIAIYGRLIPCEHAFCLTCARSDSSCYLCDERIQKIQTIKMMEGIFICAAPHCLKSFLKRSEFESHVHEVHADLLQQEMYPDGANEAYPMNATRPAQPESSTARGPPRPGFLPNLNSQIQDREDRTRCHQSRESTPMRPPIQQMQLPFHGYQQQQSAESQPDNNNNNQPPQVWFQNPQTFDHQSGLQNKHMGIPTESPFRDHNTPTHTFQLPNYPMQQMPAPMPGPMVINTNPGLNPSPQFNYSPPQPIDGSHPYYTSNPEGGGHQDQSSLLGFPPPVPVGATGFPGNTRQWNAVGFVSTQFESISAVQGNPEGFPNIVDNQGRAAAFVQGDYARVSESLPVPVNHTLQQHAQESDLQSGLMDDGKGILAPPSVS